MPEMPFSSRYTRFINEISNNELNTPRLNKLLDILNGKCLPSNYINKNYDQNSKERRKNSRIQLKKTIKCLVIPSDESKIYAKYFMESELRNTITSIINRRTLSYILNIWRIRARLRTIMKKNIVEKLQNMVKFTKNRNIYINLFISRLKSSVVNTKIKREDRYNYWLNITKIPLIDLYTLIQRRRQLLIKFLNVKMRYIRSNKTFRNLRITMFANKFIHRMLIAGRKKTIGNLYMMSMTGSVMYRYGHNITSEFLSLLLDNLNTGLLKKTTTFDDSGRIKFQVDMFTHIVQIVQRFIANCGDLDQIMVPTRKDVVKLEFYKVSSLVLTSQISKLYLSFYGKYKSSVNQMNIQELLKIIRSLEESMFITCLGISLNVETINQLFTEFPLVKYKVIKGLETFRYVINNVKTDDLKTFKCDFSDNMMTTMIKVGSNNEKKDKITGKTTILSNIFNIGMINEILVSIKNIKRYKNDYVIDDIVHIENVMMEGLLILVDNTSMLQRYIICNNCLTSSLLDNFNNDKFKSRYILMSKWFLEKTGIFRNPDDNEVKDEDILKIIDSPMYLPYCKKCFNKLDIGSITNTDSVDEHYTNFLSTTAVSWMFPDECKMEGIRLKMKIDRDKIKECVDRVKMVNENRKKKGRK